MSDFGLYGVLLAGAALLLGGVLFAAYRWGKTSAVASIDTRSLEIKDAQLQAGAQRPDAAALARELRNGKF
jgi:F0F1-type ATP synthase membrane subunit b/b'